MASHISVELVPRSVRSLLRDARLVARYGEVTHLNVTDLERFPLRSIEAVRLIRKHLGNRFICIPHIPASRVPLIEPETFPGHIALVVGGDRPSKGVPRALSTVKYMEKLRCRVRLMAGLDQYRSSASREIAYMHRKISAGAEGFFTQPFFSLDHLEYWDSLLSDALEIFYGISPVTTPTSLAYWRDVNRVVFPHSFKPTLERQVVFARQAIKWAKKRDRSLYLMPIRLPLDVYLASVFR